MLYGLPEKEWDLTVDKAEDFFHEEEIGDSIIGVWPTGGRVFGCESARPCVLFIYINNPISKFDPSSYLTDKDIVIQKTKDSIFIYVEFLEWARSYFYQTVVNETFSNVMPTCTVPLKMNYAFSDIFFEASYLIQLLQMTTRNNNLDIPSRLAERAYLLYLKKDKFYPQTNPKWGQVVSFDRYYNCGTSVDDKFVDPTFVSRSISLQSEFFLTNQINRVPVTDKKRLTKFSKNVTEIYRRLM